MIIAENDVVVCPACKISLYVITENFKPGDVLRSKALKALEGTGEHFEYRVICEHCQSSFVRVTKGGIQIHTQDGWRP